MINENTKPTWMDGRTVCERMFCEYFTEKHNLIYYGGNFFDENGILSEILLSKMVAEEVKDYVDKNLAMQVEKIMKAFKLLYVVTEIKKDTDVVCFANGNYNLKDGTFSESHEITPNRIAVSYNPDAKKPEKWLKFLDDLFYPEDIITVQQYLGYCMIPTSEGQYYLTLIGEGGEGKSIVGNIATAVFGCSCTKLKLSTLMEGKFSLPMIENKLLMIDDDMQMAALKETDVFKSFITNDGKMIMEGKHKALYEGDVYARLLAFSNGNIEALYDKSEAFRRRQLVINVKPKDPDRVDNKTLSREICNEELEGIALWMLEGLKRVKENGYHFDVSERTRKNMQELKKNDNNIILFLESENYLCFGHDQTSTTKAIYYAYCQWCDDNFYEAFKKSTFEKKFRKVAEKFGIKPKTVHTLEGKDARGYEGVSIRLNLGERLIKGNTDKKPDNAGDDFDYPGF